jgi:excinuclease ABC subunit C
MSDEKLLKKVNNLPRTPGTYLFKNKANKVIYVGKAKRLRDRVKSYFSVRIQPGTKTAALVRQIHNLDYVEVSTELEALILEASLIKKHRPKYNIVLKDDKSYLYIIIRNEKVTLNGEIVALPKILYARETDLKKEDMAFGPFPNTGTTRQIIRTIRKFFPFRDCSPSKFRRYTRLNQPCLYGHLGLCQAPCIQQIALGSYKKEIKKIRNMLEGKGSSIVKKIEEEMYELSKAEKFEGAAQKRDLLQKFSFVTNKFRTADRYMENPYLVQDLAASALDDLLENIPILKAFPRRIECYDISNLSGKEATGSMVVAEVGRLNKAEYRRFKIRKKDSPDDVDMMREVLERRLKRKGWPLPELIVVDGGKGQVSAALDVINEYQLDICVIGLTKRFETIMYKSGKSFDKVQLERTSLGLQLLQKLRDEAHRFAKQYHLKLRKNKLTS